MLKAVSSTLRMPDLGEREDCRGSQEQKSQFWASQVTSLKIPLTKGRRRRNDGGREHDSGHEAFRGLS